MDVWRSAPATATSMEVSAGLGTRQLPLGRRSGAEEATGRAPPLPARRHDPEPGQPVRRARRLLARRHRPGGQARAEHAVQLRTRHAPARPACLRAPDLAGDRCRTVRRPAQAARPALVRPVQAGEDGDAAGVRARGAPRGHPEESDRRGRATAQAQADPDSPDRHRGQRDPCGHQGLGAHPRNLRAEP